jgi:hypothetical protein
MKSPALAIEGVVVIVTAPAGTIPKVASINASAMIRVPFACMTATILEPNRQMAVKPLDHKTLMPLGCYEATPRILKMPLSSPARTNSLTRPVQTAQGMHN